MTERYLPKVRIDFRFGDVLTEYDDHVWSNRPPKNPFLRVYGTLCAVDNRGAEHLLLYLIVPSEIQSNLLEV